MSKRIGIWLRVSTEDQVRGESPEHHEERARAYASAKGWTVAETYRLDAVSGKSVRGHTEAKRMLEDVRRGHITGIVFSKLARLARNTRELLEFAEEFQRHGADLVSLQESIDTSSAAGRLFYTMIGAVGQWEREETSERVSASVPVRARLGKSTGGQASFGYRWEKGRLVPDPTEGPVRALIYQLYREHRRKRTVAGMLNERGYRTRNGGLFSGTTVGRLLADPTAKGVRIANKCVSNGEGRGWKLKRKEDWVEVEVEAVVSEQLWEECRTIAQEVGEPFLESRARRPVYLFAGVVYCGTCGGTKKLYRQTGWDKYRCGACATKIPEDDLEAILVEQLSAFLLSEEKVGEMIDRSAREAAERQGLAETLRRDRKALEQKTDALIDLYQNGGLDLAAFRRRNEPAEARLKEIEAELAKLEREAGAANAAEEHRRAALEDGATLRDEWPRMGFAQRRRIVETLVEKVTVSKDGVEFGLRYYPTFVKSPREDRDSSRSPGYC